ncbi:hypothetical protein [Variovorax boronicumulans]|uniref:hypothetical protein n=1 Tax=Variovorax boronicumulans TaxID=436515 RepID=UPI0033920FCA
MHVNTPGFSHASVERLCDYELPAPPASAAQVAPLAPTPDDDDDAQNLALNWWLWMDGMSKNMLRHYDAWREQFDQATRKGPTRGG